MLMDYIECDIKRRFVPFLLALEATKQDRVIEDLDTEGIRHCLNLKKEGQCGLTMSMSLKV